MMLAVTPVAQKFLRYRSKKCVPHPEPTTTPENREPISNRSDEAPKLQSMSRYRRPRGMFRPDSRQEDSPAELPTSSKRDIRQEEEEEEEDPRRRNLDQIKEIEVEDAEENSTGPKQSGRQMSLDMTHSGSVEKSQRETELIVNTRSFIDIQGLEDKGNGSPISPSETQKAIEKQKLLDLQRLEAELAAAPPSPKFPPRQSPRKKKLIELISKKNSYKYTPPSTPITPTSSVMTKSSPDSQHSKGIGKRGREFVPHVDAPVSISNERERRALIRHKNTCINLPVSPKTTPTDIIQSAANTLNQKIDPSATILLELYTPLGLERPLRSYEYIRDVMNSWDRDTQNALILEPQDPLDIKFDPSHSPATAPVDHSFYFYHSQKRGKWNKRHVTLLASGQIFTAKKLHVKPSDKDCTNICHLSEYDIYRLSSPQAQKNLGSPKKNCYAIKSQQKSIMFLSTENFVQYFSTDDDALAESFYKAVQQWRSWFLKNHREEGRQSPRKDRKTPAGSITASTNEENINPAHPSQPLLSLNSYEGTNVKGEDTFDDRPLKIPFRRNSRQNNSPSSIPESQEEIGEFPSSSLLGRTYTQRKRELEDSGYSKTAASIRRPGTSTNQSETLLNQRSLLDFTPSPKDLPPWKRPGKSQGVRVIKGVPLIEVATTPGLPRDFISPTLSIFKRDEAGIIHCEKSRSIADMTSEGPFVKGGLISGGAGITSTNRWNQQNKARR